MRRCLSALTELLLTLILALSACKPRTIPEGRGLLPSRPADQLKPAGVLVAPFGEKFGGAAFARIVFRTPGPSNTEITIREVTVGPRSEGRLGVLQGPAVIDLSSGTGRVVAGDKTVDLAVGRPAAVPARSAIVLQNSSDLPLVVRLYLLEGSR